jgi:scyllo-inositol 2-dehydrogenase (NADP+)
MADKTSTIRCAIIGYGGAFNMGRAHGNWINAAPGMEVVAVCDLDASREAAAKEDFPGCEFYTDVSELLSGCDFDLAAIVTPHNTHAAISVQCSQAGKHVVVEKPMCISVAEADAMIGAAQAAGTIVTVFHNRRHDGDFLALKEIVEKGLIGDVFKVEVFMGGYGHPGTWWRANKAISGGAFYDWGAHLVDWLLHVMPQRMTQVSGWFHKLVWMDVTNEDHVHAVIVFESGATADVQLSSLARVGKPRWLLLGTKGAIKDAGGHFEVSSEVEGIPAEMRIAYKKADWAEMPFYTNLAKHLLEGAPLEVTPESARRPIAVFETAEKSSAAGQPLPVPHEEELHL